MHGCDSVTRQMVAEVSNEHISFIFKCQAIQELTLHSSETYDTNQPNTQCHITEDPNLILVLLIECGET
jgi:hypothetical protein